MLAGSQIKLIKRLTAAMAHAAIIPMTIYVSFSALKLILCWYGRKILITPGHQYS